MLSGAFVQIRARATAPGLSGWPAARTASGAAGERDWMIPYLAQLLDDPYDSVRFVAERSLRKRPPFADFAYDFLSPAVERRRATQHAVGGSAFTHANAPEDNGAAILMDGSGSLETERFGRLLRKRDDSPVLLRE